MGKSRFLLRSTVLLVIALTVGFTCQALAKTDSNANAASRKIVIFEKWLTSDSDKDNIIQKTGAQKIKDLKSADIAVVLATPAAEKLLREQDGIIDILPDIEVSISAKPSGGTPDQILPWGVNRIDAEKVWATDTACGVKVAVLDTGIDLDHPDLKGNIAGGYNCIKPSRSADDDNGHGSHVAGIISGINNSIGIVGVAPQAQLYAVKVLNAAGSGYLSDIAEGLEWCWNNGIQVVNMSFGSSGSADWFYNSYIKPAYYDHGIVLIAAAGNDGADNTVNFPARYPEVIAVSATGSTDTLASFSSRGLEIDLAAPGVGIKSTYKGGGGYQTLSGTSMATPHVVGTAALVIGNHPGISNIDVISRLCSTADDLGDTGIDNLYGNGLVDAQEAATGVQSTP